MTCKNKLGEQIDLVSERVGTESQIDDKNSPQYKAKEWITEECDATVPINPCTESQLPIIDQRYALAVMYFSLGGDDWNDGANPGLDYDASPGTWLSGLNYCEWGRLDCDDFGNVLEIDFGKWQRSFLVFIWRGEAHSEIALIFTTEHPLVTDDNKLAGEIPPEIGVLVNMTVYGAYKNQQTGSIPTTLGLITQLQEFDVEDNSMTGQLFQSDYVGGPNGLKNVVFWYTSGNDFEGSIPVEIGEWTKIEELYFGGNNITGTIPTEIGNLENMRKWTTLMDSDLLACAHTTALLPPNRIFCLLRESNKGNDTDRDRKHE